MERLLQSLKPLLLPLSIALWSAIGFWFAFYGYPVASLDDFPRLVLAMKWARESTFAVSDAYWLPLPIWIYGLWYKFAGDWMSYLWHIPVSAAAMAGATACVGWTATLLAAPEPGKNEGSRSRFLPGAIAVALVLTVPSNWRMSATGLSEPIFFFFQSAALLSLVSAVRRPGPAPTIALLVCCVALSMTRYEGIPIAGVIWSVGILGAAKPAKGPGKVKLWLAGAAVLAVFPVVWMAINHQVHGDALRFLDAAKLKASEAELIAGRSIFYRLGLLGELAIRQGWVVLIPAMAGSILAFRNSTLARGIALCWIAGAAIYFQAAVSNTIGAIWLERFCLGMLWAAVPLAAATLSGLVDRTVQWFYRDTSPAKQIPIAPVAMLLLLAAIGFQVSHRNPNNWGGWAPEENEMEICRGLASMARKEQYTAVLREPFSEESINLLRVFMKPENVRLEKWYPEEPITQGKFLLFVPKGKLPGYPPAGELFGQEYYEVIAIPARAGSFMQRVSMGGN